MTARRLRTFGPPALLGADDAIVLGSHGHHRRRLALLAVLAAAGPLGRSRDHLLLLFWPDATQARARHSLDQLLYALRASLGESLLDGVNPVRLNASVVSSDIADFNDALSQGRLAAAVDAYRGPFLDGFYLGDAPEFEQWAEAERSRLARSCANAVERLARAAVASGDHATAVQRWEQLVALDPLSSRSAIGLLEALRDAGDATGALQFAKRYESLVTQELDTAVDAPVASLVASMRVGVPHGGQARQPHAFPPIGVAPVPAPTRHPRRKAPYIIGALLMLSAVAAGIIWRVNATSPVSTKDTRPSIAVLPLMNVSGAPQDAALVDGLTEELIAMLARLGDLRVIGSSSSFIFRGSTAGTRRIADSLGVANILEGSAQRDGGRLRVQLRLLSAADGTTRWAQTYDRELSDIFTVQSDIAGAVAHALDVRLGSHPLPRTVRHGTTNVAAYEEYLQGSDPAVTRSDSAADAALAHFRQAVALDPNYAAAYAGLARLYIRSPTIDGHRVPLPVRRDLALRAALKAVSLDDSLAEAHATLGLLKRNQYDFAGAEEESTRATELEPDNPRFHEWLAQLYIVLARPEEALAQARRAVELDPLSATANAEVARALMAAGRCDEALTLLDRLKGLKPPLLRAGAIAAQCYARRGMWPPALALVQQMPDPSPTNRAVSGYLLARAGRTVEARQTLATLLDRSTPEGGTAFDIGLVYAGLGDNDAAFAWLNKAVSDQTITFDWFPMLIDCLHTDPRFAQLLERLGIQKR